MGDHRGESHEGEEVHDHVHLGHFSSSPRRTVQYVVGDRGLGLRTAATSAQHVQCAPEPLEPLIEGLVSGVVVDGEQEQGRDPGSPAEHPGRLLGCGEQAPSDSEGDQQVDGVVHEVVELDTVEGGGAVVSRKLAVDMIQEVPDLEEDGSECPAGDVSAGKGGCRCDSACPGRQGDGVGRDTPRRHDPGDAQGGWADKTARHPVADPAMVGLLAALFEFGQRHPFHGVFCVQFFAMSEGRDCILSWIKICPIASSPATSGVSTNGPILPRTNSHRT